MIRDIPQQVRRTGARAFFRIADLWRLTPDQARRLLGLEHAADLDALRRAEVPVSDEVTERVSLVTGIYVALTIVFSTPERQLRWLTSGSAGERFGAATPLDAMMQADVAGLYGVRGHLDAALD